MPVRLIKDNLFYLAPYFFFLVFGAILMALVSPEKLHIYFNGLHSQPANTLFYYLTFLGDGWTAVIISAVLLSVRFRYSLITIMSYGLSSLITQSLKHFVFNDRIRPVRYFEGVHSLYLIPGVDMNSYYSFPSGHSTTAFSVLFCLALFSADNRVKGFLIGLTLLVAFSRVYLSQHFFADIYAGSLVGVFSSGLIFCLCNTFLKSEKLNSGIFAWKK